MSNDTGFVYDSRTQTFTELYWVKGVWLMKDGTVYRTVPMTDPMNMVVECSPNLKEEK